MQKIYTRAAAALLRLQQRRPMLAPLSQSGVDIIECQCSRMRDPQPPHQGGLRGLAEFERKGSRPVEDRCAAEFKRSHQRKRQGHCSCIAPDISAWACLVEIKRSFRHSIGIESSALEVESSIAYAPVVQSGKKRLLPLGMLEKDDQVVFHFFLSL